MLDLSEKTGCNCSKYNIHLVLKHGSPEAPDAGEAEVEFVPFLRTVEGRVGGVEQAVEQVTEHLDVGHLHDGCDLLEPS
jgi:hypothetical protein